MNVKGFFMIWDLWDTIIFYLPVSCCSCKLKVFTELEYDSKYVNLSQLLAPWFVVTCDVSSCDRNIDYKCYWSWIKNNEILIEIMW